MARCPYCERELPGVERVCRGCFDELYFSPQRPKGTTVQKLARLARLAPVTCILISINFIVFVLMLQGTSALSEFSKELLIKWGADYGPLTLNGQYWRLLTSMFLHLNFAHVFFNMLALLSLGLLAERAFGRVAFLVGYFGAGICSSLLSEFFHSKSVCMGASGAIFGLAGMLIPPLLMGRLAMSPKLLARPLWNLAVFAAYNLLMGAVEPGINNAAHIGGFLFGVLMGGVYSISPRSLVHNFVPDLESPAQAQVASAAGSQ